ncbi:hypothetical protein ccbrp13_69970 [Ktedonobacteria bacterium brp13]|nr:hypothetical protein ccbrp13_69970 [Ktedonobacteria bacterium brp13]
MTYSLRQMALDDKICQQNQLDIFEKVYPREHILDLLTELNAWEDRERLLNMMNIFLVMLAAGIWTRLSYPSVLRRLNQPLHVLGYDVHHKMPSASAISQRRKQLGPDLFQCLFERACLPMTNPQTKGAFRFGRRIMAIDGTVQDVPDTLANREAFGRSRNQKGEGPFPQIRWVSLSECGSHAIVDVEMSGLAQGERTSSYALLRSVTSEMFVLNDSGFSGAVWWRKLREKGAHGMGPLPVHHLPTYCHLLEDGSYLAAYLPAKGDDQRSKHPLLIRVIEYRITDER